ncbi:MAG TPA: prepilin peptidase [Phenylobacterium sp.]|nr:prepilin peptidase [Phenylobacterium sp.]HLZ76861.1 prepilin peptidase [Phenylobacterium sp.]
MLHAAQTLLLLIFPALVIAGALKDLTSFTIPNQISLALAAAFPIAAIALGVSPSVIGLSVAVGVVALVMGMGMFAAGWIGGGDAKLFAAAALWLGLPGAMSYLLFTCMAGGALAIGLLGLRSQRVRAIMPAGPAWFTRLAEPGENVPYGVAIAVGALAAFPVSPLAAHL